MTNERFHTHIISFLFYSSWYVISPLNEETIWRKPHYIFAFLYFHKKMITSVISRYYRRNYKLNNSYIFAHVTKNIPTRDVNISALLLQTKALTSIIFFFDKNCKWHETVYFYAVNHKKVSKPRKVSNNLWTWRTISTNLYQY